MAGRATACAYGSEGWELESLRARLLPRSGNTLHARPTRPESSTFLILSVATLARCIAVERLADIGVASLPAADSAASSSPASRHSVAPEPPQGRVRPAPAEATSATELESRDPRQVIRQRGRSARRMHARLIHPPSRSTLLARPTDGAVLLRRSQHLAPGGLGYCAVLFRIRDGLGRCEHPGCQ